ncbi:ATP-binding protein [Chitinilyticum aquatile]|uniref:ATP-binding protein n=1 Tax=Chitinilyticum aquatile TaxID=362520 RepID=UPI0009D73F26|nr:ATP-binding protein [Chitinilyticum aquatile]
MMPANHGGMSPTEIVVRVQASTQALSRGDIEAARINLLLASHGLYQLASDSDRGLRSRRVALAHQLYAQANQLPQPAISAPSRLLNAGESPTPSPALPPVARLADVAGCEEVKRIFRSKYMYPMRNPDKAALYKQNGAGGVLLYGPPGTGKTFLARALAGELGIPVFVLKPSDVLSKWLGDGEKQLATLFAEAQRHPAALIFVDELDALAKSRDDSEGNSAVQRILTQLLTELDGFALRKNKLLFIGATNRPWDIDTALLRAGRFDALAYVGLPESSVREQLLRHALEGIPQGKDLDFAYLAHSTEGYSGAEICAIAAQAAQDAFLDAIEHGGNRPVCKADMLHAIGRIHRAATPEILERYARFGGKPPKFPVEDKRESEPRACPDLARSMVVSPTIPATLPWDEGKTFIPATPQSYEPLQVICARDLVADIETLPFICYALQHVGINPVRKLTLHNKGKEESQNLLVEVALVPDDFGAAWTCNIPELKNGSTWECNNISLPLRLDRLQQVAEKERAHIRITVRDKEEVLFAKTEEIPVLAYNEWLFLPEFMQLTAAFVQPNSPALLPVLEKAATVQEKMSGSRAFPGYQRNDPAQVWQMLAAIHETLSSHYPIDYINPPPSFEKTGQKVRLVADTLASQRGTCIDLAILQAALWEHIGLHPCIVLVPGHAFMACWMSEVGESEPVVRISEQTAGAKKLLKALQDGSLQAINSVEITSGQSIEIAQKNARDYLNQALEKGGDVYIIDIHAARNSITPLP